MKYTHRYQLFFDEKPSILRPKNNLYWVEIEFDSVQQKGQLRIPDCGGMMDMLPKSSQQEAWIKSILTGLNTKQIWVTIWDLLDESTYKAALTKIKNKRVK